MKKILFLFSIFTLLLGSCSGNSNSASADEEGLTPQQRDAVRHVKNHLDKNEKLVSYEIAEGSMPAALMTDEYKKYRDGVFKAGLDYVNCLKRGLTGPAEQQAQKILDYQSEINTKIQDWEQEQGTSKYLFVLADIQNKRNSNHPYSKLIAVFNPVTMQNDFWLPLTTVFVNNAALILNAQAGTLVEYATNPQFDYKSLLQGVDNPVLQFIFNADPSTLK